MVLFYWAVLGIVWGKILLPVEIWPTLANISFEIFLSPQARTLTVTRGTGVKLNIKLDISYSLSVLVCKAEAHQLKTLSTEHELHLRVSHFRVQDLLYGRMTVQQALISSPLPPCGHK